MLRRMRIALIASESSAAVPSALAGHFRGRGHEVRVLALRDRDPDSLLLLAQLAERPDDFDIVHTFAGHGSLLQLGAIRAPVVVTITQDEVARAPAVFKHYNERVHYVAGDAQPLLGLRLAATIASEASQGCAAAYEELYTTLIARTATISRRPWGYYVVLADEPDHKVKRLVVYPGKRLSLQKHKRRSEHWFVISGEAQVTRDEELLRLTPGRCIEIPVGAWHRVQNPANSDMAFIEVQTGDYFGEDDIERKEDDFGRA
jgi:mannose-6-phosphate isomerase-like protein (cupin superfamily)